ncbi:MAG: hypothetical protein RL708_214 [Bacteroidota bacterium]
MLEATNGSIATTTICARNKLTTMKTLAKIFLSIVGLILLLLLGVKILGVRADIANDITGNKIKQVKKGMTLEQVVAILGRPYSINSLNGLHDISCRNSKSRLEMDINNQTNIKEEVEKIYSDTSYCCEGNKEDLQNKFVTLTYTRPIKLSNHYPMLWVHLDSTYKVSNVYAKQYDGLLGLDDPSIYSDSVIDEKKFNNCFK